MQKFFKFILILVTFIGLLSPMISVNAQTEPTGTCYRQNLPEGRQSGYTRTACVGGIWEPADAPKGDCVINGVKNTGWAQAACAQSKGTWTTPYQFLAPLPCEKGTPGCPDGKLTEFDPTQEQPLGAYLNIMIRIIIGIASVMAVVMMVIGGMEYMTSELVHTKSEAIDRMQNAVLGLVIALGSWALLNTINPTLLDVNVNLPDANINVDLELSNSIYIKQITPGNIARCTPVTTGPCTESNLSIFGSKAQGMSKICNIESGGNANAVSGTDKGTDGTPFSFGLLQINLLANGSVIKDASGNSCSNLFIRSSDGVELGGRVNYIRRDSNGKVYYDAKLKPGMESRYESCKATLLDPVKNIQIAKVLFDQGTSGFRDSMFAWRGDVGVCASAFQ